MEARDIAMNGYDQEALRGALREKQRAGEMTYARIAAETGISQNAPMLVKTLELALLPENPQITGEMAPAINFLNDRGYIKVTEPETWDINPLRGVMVRISDRGQDAVEGAIKDESVIFADGR